MLVKILQDTEIPNLPLLKAGTSHEVADALASDLCERGVAEPCVGKGYETQDITPKKRRVH